MSAIVCYDDPCPECRCRHRLYPHKCYDKVVEEHSDAVLSGDEQEALLVEGRREAMRNYAVFWELLGDKKEREGDVE